MYTPVVLVDTQSVGGCVMLPPPCPVPCARADGRSIRDLQEALFSATATMRRAVQGLGRRFGSRKHLEVNYRRLGVCEGVPLVTFAHEAAVSTALNGCVCGGGAWVGGTGFEEWRRKGMGVVGGRRQDTLSGHGLRRHGWE